MSEALESVSDRRRLLTVGPNPRAGLDYLVTFQSDVAIEGSIAKTAITIRYVPDREIIDRDTLSNYLAHAAHIGVESLEDLGQRILGDLNSELVPRWLHVALRRDTDGVVQHVVLEDRQPTWKNPSLLARMASI